MVFGRRVFTIKSGSIYKQKIGNTGDHSIMHVYTKGFLGLRKVFGYMFVIDEPNRIDAGTVFKSCKSYKFNTYENVWLVIINPHPHDITVIVDNKVSVLTVAYHSFLKWLDGMMS